MKDSQELVAGSLQHQEVVDHSQEPALEYLRRMADADMHPVESAEDRLHILHQELDKLHHPVVDLPGSSWHHLQSRRPDQRMHASFDLPQLEIAGFPAPETFALVLVARHCSPVVEVVPGHTAHTRVAELP